MVMVPNRLGGLDPVPVEFVLGEDEPLTAESIAALQDEAVESVKARSKDFDNALAKFVQRALLPETSVKIMGEKARSLIEKGNLMAYMLNTIYLDEEPESDDPCLFQERELVAPARLVTVMVIIPNMQGGYTHMPHEFVLDVDELLTAESMLKLHEEAIRDTAQMVAKLASDILAQYYPLGIDASVRKEVYGLFNRNNLSAYALSVIDLA
jgi:hypothetical protein